MPRNSLSLSQGLFSWDTLSLCLRGVSVTLCPPPPSLGSSFFISGCVTPFPPHKLEILRPCFVPASSSLHISDPLDSASQTALDVFQLLEVALLPPSKPPYTSFPTGTLSLLHVSHVASSHVLSFSNLLLLLDLQAERMRKQVQRSLRFSAGLMGSPVWPSVSNSKVQ